MGMSLIKRSAVICAAGVPFLLGISISPIAAQAGGVQTGPLTGLTPHHITISVENLDGEIAWYKRVLGCTVGPFNDVRPGYQVRNLSLPGYRFDLIKNAGSSRPAEVNPRYLRQGFVHIAFGVQDLVASYKQLQDLKTDVAADKDANGVVTRIILHDPEGNEIEFFKPL